jgi:pyruvate carboxylase
LYEHEIPGGQFTNLCEQAAAMGLGHRWREVEKTYAEVNQLFGDIVKVTPSSKVVGDMALFLLANEIKPADLLKLSEDHDVSLPNSVVEMFSGALGVPPGGWPKKLQRIILRGQAPLKGRPGASLPAVNFEEAKAELEKKVAHHVRRDDLLSYLLYPDVYLKFNVFRQAYSDVSVLPTPAFFYGLKAGEEITIDIESGKTMIVKFLTTSDAHPDGTRTLFFELNGQPREVEVVDRSLAGSVRETPMADPADPSQIAAPLPGLVVGVAVSAGDAVRKGQKLLSLEAMKMETTIYAERPGRVIELLAAVGRQVKTGELLLKLGPET